MKRARQILFIAIVVTVGFGAMLAACKRDAAAAPKTPPPLHVQIVHPRSGVIARSIVIPARIRAWQETLVYARTSGYVKTICVDRGDEVTTGDVLAELDTPELIAETAKASAELAGAKLEADRFAAALKKAPDLVLPQQVDAAQAKAAAAQAQLERVQAMLEFARIMAPFAGVITERFVDPGAFVPAATSGIAAKNAAIVALADFSKVRVLIDVPQPETPHVSTGSLARITLNELPGRKFDGKVSRIAYALDGVAKTMTAEVDLGNPDRALRPGMYAHCRLELEKRTGVLLVPAEALVMEKKKVFVFVHRKGKAARTPVKTGFDDGVSVEILEGVTASDEVVAAGKQSLSDGQAITIAD